MQEWFEEFHEDLWLKADETGEEEGAYIRKTLCLESGQKVLDVPCGAGRVAVHLAKAGLQVTGLDVKPEFIARAKKRFSDEGLSGDFSVRDMREIEFSNEFHGAFNWSGSFGYFSDAENFGVLRGMARALLPGGRLLIDQPNREYLLRHFIAENKKDNVTIRNRWNPLTERVESTYTMKKDGREESYPLVIRLYTRAQFQRMFLKAGLIPEAAFDRAGKAFRKNSMRLVVLGRKA